MMHRCTFRPAWARLTGAPIWGRAAERVSQLGTLSQVGQRPANSHTYSTEFDPMNEMSSSTWVKASAVTVSAAP